MHVITAAPVPSDRRAEVAALLGAGFAADPLITRMVPGDPGGRRFRLTRLYRDLLAHPWSGQVVDLAVRDGSGGDGEVVGAAVWTAPVREPAQDRWAGLATAVRVLRTLGWTGARGWRRMEHAFEAAQPSAPHWYLGDVVVSEAARGEGVGSALLEHRLRAVDAERADAYLEATTEGSARLYARFGFEPRGAVAGLGPDGPQAMWRAARDE